VQVVREEYTKKKRQPFKLKDFRGVDQDSIEKLSSLGIITVDDLLKSGRTKSQRRTISEKSGVLEDKILELAKLSDLSRLGAIKSVRARLYHDSGFDIIEKMAKVSADELIEATKEFIERTGFDGIPPTPKEAQNAVNAAKRTKSYLEL
jgi:hypothetical protein